MKSNSGRPVLSSADTSEWRAVDRRGRPAPEPKPTTRPTPPQQQPVSEVAAAHTPAPVLLPEASASSAGALACPRAVFPAHGTQTQRVLDALRRAAEAVEAHVTASGDAELADAAAGLLVQHATRLRASGGAQPLTRASNPGPTKPAVVAPQKAAAVEKAPRWADDEVKGDAAPMHTDAAATAEVNQPTPPPWTTARDWTAVLGLPQQQHRETASRTSSRSSSSASSGTARRIALAERTIQKQSGAQARRAALEAQRVASRLARRSQTSARGGEEGATTPLTARLARAQAQRDAHLRTVVQKATEESRKVGEVAFITGLEALNRKLELQAKLRASETRRQSALEAKKAAAAAAASVAVDEANERRRQAEAERTARLSAVLADKEQKALALAAERAADAERVEKAAAAERARREELRAAENATAARKAAAIVERLAEAAARRSAHLAARSAGTLSPRSSDCGGGTVAATSPPAVVWPHDEGGTALPPSRGSISRASSPRDEAGVGQMLSSPREQGRRSIPGQGGLSAALALDFAAAERAAADAAASEAAVQRTVKRIKKLRSRLAGRTQQWPEGLAQQKPAAVPAQHKAMVKLTAALGRAVAGGLDVATAHECQRTAMAALDEGRPYGSLNAARQTGFLAAVAAATCTATAAMCQGPTSREGSKHSRVAEPLIKALLALLAVVPSNVGALLCSGAMLTLADPLLQLLGEEAAAARSHAGEAGNQAVCKALCRLVSLVLTPQQQQHGDSDAALPAALTDTVAAQSEDLAELLVHSGCLALARDVMCLGDKPQPGEDVPSLYGAVLMLLASLVERIAPPTGTPGSAAGAALMAALRETAFAGTFAFLADILLKGRRARTSTTSGLSPTGSPPGSAAVVLSPRAMPSNFDAVAASALRCVSSAARLQRDTWQTCVGSPGLRAEVTLVSASLLGHCCAVSSDITSPARDALLAETVLFLGLFASKCSSNAAILRWGPPPTLLQRLVALPLTYFTNTASRHVLFPTLLAACVTGPADDGHNLRVVGRELALSAFAEYLDELEHGQSAVPDGRFAPSTRFGQDMWPHARAALQRSL